MEYPEDYLDEIDYCDDYYISSCTYDDAISLFGIDKSLFNELLERTEKQSGKDSPYTKKCFKNNFIDYYGEKHITSVGLLMMIELNRFTKKFSKILEVHNDIKDAAVKDLIRFQNYKIKI